MTTYRSLRSLLRACGLTPASGMSFLGNVPGAASTAHISDYILYSWLNWASSDASGTKNHLDTIHFTFDFSANTKWAQYLRIASPSSLAVGTDISSDPAGRDATNAGGAWASAYNLTGQSLAVQLHGRALNGTYSGGSGVMSLIRNYYKFYTYPDAPTGTQDEDWEIVIDVNAGTYNAPVIVADTFNVVIQYPQTATEPGQGEFNPLLEHQQSVTVNGYDAGPAPSNTPQVEWHTNSSFTSLYSTNPNGITFTVNAGNPSGDFYVRYRYHPTDSWTSFASNPIHYHDTRFP